MAAKKLQPTTVKFLKLHDNAVLPEKATSGASGFDLVAVEGALLQPGSRAVVRTGLAMEIPHGYEAQIRPRSGMAAKHGITVLNSPGTIDSDFRGEVKVILQNHGPAHEIKLGDRIAQMVIQRVPQVEFEEVTSLTDTGRSTGGFGSTGS